MSELKTWDDLFRGMKAGDKFYIENSYGRFKVEMIIQDQEYNEDDLIDEVRE